MSENQEVQVEEVVEQVEETQVSTAPEVDEDTLKEAKRQGWVPQEDYTGPEDKWVDAETFVKKGREINAILRKDNEFLKREVSEMKETMQEFKKFHVETEKRAYDRAMAYLREQDRKSTRLNSSH